MKDVPGSLKGFVERQSKRDQETAIKELGQFVSNPFGDNLTSFFEGC
jgi:hypothetical protein